MREILFRGKNFDNGVWVQGYYVRLNGNKHFIYTGQSDVDCGSYYPDYYPVAAKTVGQFTGLTDKNGTKIFEGDIVKLTDKHYETEWTAQVVFGNPYAEYSWGWNFYYIGEKPQVNTDVLLWVEMEDLGVYCEVIGNIHDNPELIGGADNA